MVGAVMTRREFGHYRHLLRFETKPKKWFRQVNVFKTKSQASRQ